MEILKNIHGRKDLNKVIGEKLPTISYMQIKSTYNFNYLFIRVKQYVIIGKNNIGRKIMLVLSCFFKIPPI